MWGMHVEYLVNQAGEKPDRKTKDVIRKRQNALERVLLSPDPEAPDKPPVQQAPKKFRDPAELMGKK